MKNRIISTILNTVLLLLFMMAAVSYNGKLFGKKTQDYFNVPTKVEVEVIKPNDAQMQALGISSVSLSPEASGVWSFQKASKTFYVINTTAFANDVYGFGGPIPMFVLLNSNKQIENVLIQENNETPEFIQSVIESGIVSQWFGMNSIEVVDYKPDVVSGATLSSNAINASISKSVLAFTNVDTESSQLFVFDLKTIIALLVIAFGVIVSFKLKNKKKLRTILLVLNVAVLGVWCGKFISLQVLLGWTENGINLMTGGVILLMLILSILMPLVFNKKAYYCFYICPFGSAQELAGKIRRKKYHPSKKVAKVLKHSQMVVTLALFVLMWLGIAADLVDYEPFSAFLFQHASPIVLVIAGLSILASVFTPRPWCRYVCPTGQILNWTNKM